MKLFGIFVGGEGIFLYRLCFLFIDSTTVLLLSSPVQPVEDFHVCLVKVSISSYLFHSTLQPI